MKEVKNRILMLTQSSFPSDTRVRNEADALAKAGYNIRVIALRRYDYEKSSDIVDGVKIYRVPEVALFKKSQTNRSWLKSQFYRAKSALGYISEYLYFTTVCFFMSIYVALKDGFDAVHIHNPPNTLFLIGIFYQLFGKKFVFDCHDLEPELYLSRYNAKNNLIYKLLLLEEKCCLKFANVVITTNESYKEINIKRGRLEPGKIFVVRNGPDLTIFKQVKGVDRLKNMGKSILIYIGVMGPQDGVDYLLRSLKELAYSLKRDDFYCLIIGKGDSVENLKKLKDDLQLQNYVEFTGRLQKEELMPYLATADIGLEPNPSNPLSNLSTLIKVMEYMALAKPIVCFDLKETRFSAKESAIYVSPNNEIEFAKAIVSLMDNPNKRAYMGAAGQKRVKEKLAWQHVSKNLLLAYESVLPKNSQKNCI